MPTEAKIAPRFGPGDPVRVAARDALGHCRTPWYLRGHGGVVVAVQGMFHDPERLAYHRPGLPRLVLYTVRFRLCDIWAGYKDSVNDQLEADLYESWLEPSR
jgi:nitrile hydratase subunit beta